MVKGSMVEQSMVEKLIARKPMLEKSMVETSMVQLSMVIILAQHNTPMLLPQIALHHQSPGGRYHGTALFTSLFVCVVCGTNPRRAQLQVSGRNLLGGHRIHKYG